MSKLIKRLIAISAAFVPAFAAMQVQAGTHHTATVKFVMANPSNQAVCGNVYINGVPVWPAIRLPAHAPKREVFRFTNWVGTPFKTSFSSDCYARITSFKYYSIRRDQTLNSF
ncbi:MAG: hypothetical protein JF606_02985 [Burkholderiales bacterium]|nr:hypothetical protein [Burkholderiales bacterium]